MRIVTLFLPGQFEDTYIYMGRLIVLTASKSIRVYSLDRMAADLEARFTDLTPVLTLMFSRNDWLVGSPFRSLMKNKEVSRSILAAFDRFPQPALEVDKHAYMVGEQELTVPSQVILDMMIYNGRLYVGADTGLYHLDIDWEGEALPFRSELTERLDARCLSLSARYGTVNASCGNEGLFSAIDDFGWISPGRQVRLRRLAEKSIRTGWFDEDLMNYTTPTTPSLMISDSDRISIGIERETRVVTDINEQPVSLDYLFDLISQEYQVQPEIVQYTYNSNRVLFVYTVRGDFFALGLRHERHERHEKRERPSVQFTRSYKGEHTRILSVNASRVGLIVETDTRVLLFSNAQWSRIVGSDVLSVRTFMRSRRYQNIVAVTTEEGVLLVGLFDDSGLVD